LHPDPHPEAGVCACLRCGSKKVDFVGYYEPRELPEVTVKYGLCAECANTVLPVDEAMAVSRTLLEKATVTAGLVWQLHLLTGGSK
jgi:hypothetical protein